MYLKDKKLMPPPGWPARKLNGTLLLADGLWGRVYIPFFLLAGRAFFRGADGVSGSVPGTGRLEGLVAG